MTVKDSYGKDSKLPAYTPLFYELQDVSLTSESNGLGYGLIEEYKPMPTVSFEF